jgi:hypothetical protein
MFVPYFLENTGLAMIALFIIPAQMTSDDDARQT